ncbi:octopine/nopaline transport system substrate-binding protein/arginine/ornithine transport system substrate-binding protein [Phyllobacterium myrsinacearum]|uniref:transporter substrate-binding domain-containing protein n=1 Tax=Phyllobacterium myrsinacearum TaxID=28101 RepID=UPI001028F766|nr:transporter substrate-binding domain-containing protein [Phyllobacterium myrsinacearum]RZS77813.1 octopine/nopaline transport system substrate-binding protein/arginine/ornithine transport system substrate-binding protein [Phyllobacterium myrsinacearum]
MPGILSSVRIGLVALFAGVLTFSTASAEAPKSEIRIGTDGSYRPWSGTNAAGELEGFDIELATAACSEMQRKCRFISQPWEGLIPALEQGKYDILVGGISITPQRAKRFSFTQSYGNLPINVAARKSAGLNGRKTWPDLKLALKDKTIGVQSGTQSQKFVDAELKGEVTVRLYDNQDSLNLDLLAGRIDAAVAGRSPWIDFTRSDNGRDVEVLSPDLDFAEFSYLGVGVGGLMRKNEPSLLDDWDKALCALKQRGVVTQISQKWFGFDIATAPDVARCQGKQ